jgi:DNA replication and repair protein RecF
MNKTTLSNSLISSSIQPLSIQYLQLYQFRNYSEVELSVDASIIVLTGPNGSGKTNLLEAISLLVPGKGLRGSPIQELTYQPSLSSQTNNNKNDTYHTLDEQHVAWSVNSTILGYSGVQRLTTGILQAGGRRVVKCDGKSIGSSQNLSQYMSIIWLTPQMDLLFLATSKERRRYLDRAVYHFDPEHAQRLTQYEQLVKERLRLLKEGRYDTLWLGALEQQMGELAVAIAASRQQTIAYIQQSLDCYEGLFPRATISVAGVVEESLSTMPALQLEEWLVLQWEKERDLDRNTGRTRTGIHRSDLLVWHREKQRVAAECSTGEQKALLLSLLLALVQAQATWRQALPIILLDEVIAHLDSKKREALLSDLRQFGAQCWLTGTDCEAFSSLKPSAQFVEVSDALINY